MRMEIDACDKEEELFPIQMDIQTQLSDKIKDIAKLFKEEKYEEIRKEIEEAKYLEKMLEEISIKENHIKFGMH